MNMVEALLRFTRGRRRLPSLAWVLKVHLDRRGPAGACHCFPPSRGATFHPACPFRPRRSLAFHRRRTTTFYI